MNVMGVDPGLDGAFVSWNGSKLDILHVTCYVVPSKTRGRDLKHLELDRAVKDKWNPNGSNFINEFWIEHVWAGKNQGVSSMFKFGMTYGIMKNIGINLVPEFHDINLVTPQRWKKFFGIGADKKEGYSLACEIWPTYTHEFVTPRGKIKDGICDAALIALYGYEQPRG
jgi:hypothetical protein